MSEKNFSPEAPRGWRALTVLRGALLLALAIAALVLASCGGGKQSPTPSRGTTVHTSPTSTGSAAGTSTATPTQSPTPTLPTSTPKPPTPVPPTATPAPSGPAIVITHGDRSAATIALTFDMGGRVDPALAIMQYLVAQDVPATIFMTGAMADNKYTDAGRQVLSIIAAHPSEFALGNHSYSHPDFTTLTAAQMLAELTSTETAIGRYIAVSPRPLFRPPYGSYNPAVLSAVGGAQYHYAIMWDVDTADWKPESDGGPSAAEITQHVLADARNGSIVIMHLGGYNTADALPAIVQGLRARGFHLVTIPQLLGIP